MLCNDFVLVFMVTASLHILISVKIPATNGGAFSSVISKVHCFKLYYGSGLAHILYFIMHEVICTCFLNAPGIYNQYSGFNRSVQQGELVTLGWGGFQVKTILTVYEHTSLLGKDTKACETGSVASLDLEIYHITTDVLTSRNALPSWFQFLDQFRCVLLSSYGFCAHLDTVS